MASTVMGELAVNALNSTSGSNLWRVRSCLPVSLSCSDDRARRRETEGSAIDDRRELGFSRWRDVRDDIPRSLESRPVSGRFRKSRGGMARNRPAVVWRQYKAGPPSR